MPAYTITVPVHFQAEITDEDAQKITRNCLMSLLFPKDPDFFAGFHKPDLITTLSIEHGKLHYSGTDGVNHKKALAEDAFYPDILHFAWSVYDILKKFQYLQKS